MRRVMLVLCALLAVLVLSSFVFAYHVPARRTSYIQSDEFTVSSASSYGGYYGMSHRGAMYRMMPGYYQNYQVFEDRYPRYLSNRRSGRVFYTSVDSLDVYGRRRVLYEPFPAACPYPLVAC